MASNSRLSLIDSASIGTTTSSTKSLTSRASKLIAWQQISANTGTATTVVQHSPDGASWVTLASFAAVAVATGTEAIQITVNVFPNVRAVSTLVGGTATVRCDLYFEDSK